MGLFDIIRKPLRGIGRVLRGKFKKGLGDIAAGAPLLAAIPGVGLPAALAIGAGGAGVERATEGGDLGDILGAAARGAASGAAGHYAGELVRGAGGAVAPATTTAPAATIAPSVAAASGRQAAPRGLGAIGDFLRRAPGAAAQWAQKHPELALGVASTAADVYGAQQTGQALDRELALREEEFRRRYRPRQPYDEWEVERQRLRQQYAYGGG